MDKLRLCSVNLAIGVVIMDYVFDGKHPLPDNVILPSGSGDDEDDKINIRRDDRYMRKILFDNQGKTIHTANDKMLLYSQDTKLYSVMMEMFVLKKYDYTGVINMPGDINEIVGYGKHYGICVHDVRNLKRIMDTCSDNLHAKSNQISLV